MSVQLVELSSDEVEKLTVVLYRLDTILDKILPALCLMYTS